MKILEGREAYETKENATKFSESWYDLSYSQLLQILNANTKSDFVYIKFTYQQLGCSEQWFNEVCKLLKNSWPDIRREILLEWATGVDNSPFRQEDLDALSALIKQPISEVYLLGKYRFETYLQADTITHPPIIGVDVAAGYKQDSSTITVIDSYTTKVLGCMNCNYISAFDLARCIEFIVKNWMRNAVVNVERNGGYGSSVISKLIKAGLKANLYYEIKDVVVEERQDGIHSYKQKIRTKVYGLNSTRDIRKLLIDILIDRVENHKDKILSPIIYNELLGMEVKRNGKVEHSDSTHDDQVFSMLMALYVWYEGINLGERYGIKKTAIKTDDEVDEALDFDDDTVEIVGSFNTQDELDEEIHKYLDEALHSGGSQDLNQYLEETRMKEKAHFKSLIGTPLGEKAYRTKYGIPKDQPIEKYVSMPGATPIPDSVFSGFYNPTDNTYQNENYRVVAQGAVPGNQAWMLEDEDYKYTEHFNM